ncbi:alpha/beta fold hydrolase [Dactylosporangium aurantiacum]|uniref:Alpha/beta fold hydrolase n=1 Tax=Dactylosporangium aurantiacum TaxID=35754 RepID=A0A9Q9IL82_9ACTN|nr:alpha/beta fold hydrolase [Dactylosporangium aurantiacum]MDG6106057.1 alpha/beta fold hydrolase [Dactylosporangium aurantiacum]UWZ55897.1 alpha/beta fold hydrolase [Dactylosporangium aurantiacum]
MKVETLKVPGATLHYEVRGSGPVLLLICGGVYDAEGFAGLAEALAGDRTVVTYDRRGNSRSRLDGPPAVQSVEEHGDDAYRLLAAVGVAEDEPADVFGNSSGAEIALDLAARHPELVRAVVAHEPPAFELLADGGHFREVIKRVEETFHRDGWEAAMGVFAAGIEMAGEEPAAGSAPSPDAIARMQANLPFFVGYEVPPFGGWVPDLDTLRSGPVRIVPAVGSASAGEAPHRVGVELGARLGVPVAEFPGGHGGHGDVAAFAPRLREVLTR